MSMENSIDQTFSQHQFISVLFEAEKQKYILENRREQLKNRIEETLRSPLFEDTSFYQNYHSECMRPKDAPKYPLEWLDKPKLFHGMRDIFGHIIFTAICSFIGFLIWLFFSEMLKLTVVGNIAWLVCTVFWPWMVVKNYLEKKHVYNKTQREIKKINTYNEEVDAHNRERLSYWTGQLDKIEEDRKRKFSLTVQPHIDREIKAIEKELKDVNFTLDGLYNLRINGILCIHPNYRGLIPVSVLYGYFDTGRCTQFQGHEGAYNLYEDEKMKGMIINKLDTVIQKLDELNSTMLYLAQAVEECNDRLQELEETGNRITGSIDNMNSRVSGTLNRVSNQMESIESNTANSAYYSMVSAEMAKFNTLYNLQK